MSLLRSEIVVESNLKPSQFGKPSMGGEDEFEEIYESPLEKSKPQLPRGMAEVLEELPRNASETMEFSNSRRSLQNSRNEAINDQKNSRNSQFSENSTNQKSSRNSGLSNRGFERSFEEPGNAEVHHRSENLLQVASENQNLGMIGDGKKGNLEDKPDFNFSTIVNTIKSLDVNRYATKKTIAQGMLDIALLTANASQLKYILQVGKQHEFYILMLSLISVSIGLQVIQGVICVLLGSSLNINKQQDQRKANVWNNICLVLMVLTVAVNAVISAFDMRDNSALTAGNTTKGASIRLSSDVR